MKKSPNYKRYTVQRPVWMNECLLWKASTGARDGEPEEQYAATCDAVHTHSAILNPNLGQLFSRRVWGRGLSRGLVRNGYLSKCSLCQYSFFFTALDQIWSSPLSSFKYYTPLIFQPEPGSISYRVLVRTFIRLTSSQPGLRPYSYSPFCFCF